MPTILHVENVGKKYRLGGPKAPYQTIRETITKLFSNPFGNIRKHKTNAESQFWALKNISFDVKKGEVLGIIGRNGAGKSTLLKLLSRITEPSTGRIDFYGHVGSLLEVGTGFHPELTGRENIYLNGAILGMRRQQIQRRFDEIVAFAEVDQFLDTPVKHYSSGMYVRLAFAVAAHLDPEILIVDEVLAVGDAAFQQKCIGRMGEVSRQGRTILFVSHNLSSIRELCSSALHLENGQIVQRDVPDKVIANYLKTDFSSSISFNDGPVKRVTVTQQSNSIVIIADFILPRPGLLPLLEIEVSDMTGVTLFGTNPLVTGMLPLTTPIKEGRIKAVITQPKLRDGTYKASIRFYDGWAEIFNAKDCLVFQIAGMAVGEALTGGNTGYIHPQCEFQVLPESLIEQPSIA